VGKTPTSKKEHCMFTLFFAFVSVVLLIPWAWPPSPGCSSSPRGSAIPNGSSTSSVMS